MSKGARTINLYRPATGERISGMYMHNGVWVEGAYEKICLILRDAQANSAVQMDHRLIAILDWVQRYLASHGYTQPVQITSGYRSPKTNAATEGAAKNSQHTQGRALDFAIPGVSAAYLGKLLNWLAQGGVGTYISKGFVHVDTGNVRSWVR